MKQSGSGVHVFELAFTCTWRIFWTQTLTSALHNNIVSIVDTSCFSSKQNFAKRRPPKRFETHREWRLETKAKASCTSYNTELDWTPSFRHWVKLMTRNIVNRSQKRLAVNYVVWTIFFAIVWIGPWGTYRTGLVRTAARSCQVGVADWMQRESRKHASVGVQLHLCRCETTLLNHTDAIGRRRSTIMQISR